MDDIGASGTQETWKRPAWKRAYGKNRPSIKGNKQKLEFWIYQNVMLPDLIFSCFVFQFWFYQCCGLNHYLDEFIKGPPEIHYTVQS